MSKTHFDQFAEEFSKDLKLENDFHLTKPLSELPEYDSMGKITVSLMIETLFGFQIEYSALKDATTLQELYEYCISKG